EPAGTSGSPRLPAIHPPRIGLICVQERRPEEVAVCALGGHGSSAPLTGGSGRRLGMTQRSATPHPCPCPLSAMAGTNRAGPPGGGTARQAADRAHTGRRAGMRRSRAAVELVDLTGPTSD